MSDLPSVVRPDSLITRIMLDPEFGASTFAMAEKFAESQLVPRHLQGRPSDCFIVLTMAAELRQNPLMVAQNIVIVQGTAGWKAAYVIALANSSGLLKDRIDWTVERPGGRTEFKRKTKEGLFATSMENMRVTAFATLAGTGARVEFSVDTAMAIAEGWANNEKYTSMPEVMLRWRAGAFLVRFYAGDVTLGLYTDTELETIPAERATVTQAPAKPNPSIARIAAAGSANEPVPEVRQREVIEVHSEPADEAAEQEAPAPKPANPSDVAKTIAAGATRGLTVAQLEAVVQRDRADWTEPDLRAIGTHLRGIKVTPKVSPVADEDGA